MDAPAPRLARMNAVPSPRQMAGTPPPTGNPDGVIARSGQVGKGSTWVSAVRPK